MNSGAADGFQDTARPESRHGWIFRLDIACCPLMRRKVSSKRTVHLQERASSREASLGSSSRPLLAQNLFRQLLQ
jgi:hypothetical protein